MSSERMEFPNTFKEFVEQYSFKDKEEIYTNGSDLIQVFRVMQGYEHFIADHDKQIREEVIGDFLKLCDSYCHFNKNKHPSNGYVISRASLLDIAEKMKGEQNE